MLLADSLGNKMKPTVVLKTVSSRLQQVAEINLRQRQGFGVRLFKNIHKIQSDTGMKIFGNKSGWWNEYLHKLFLEQHFADRSDRDIPVLLLLDEFSGHWTPLVQDYAATINVHLMRVAVGLTSVCQPADISWMKPFKDQMRGSWVESLMHQLDHHIPHPPFKMEAPRVETVCDWVVLAWEKVSIRSICAGFERAHIQDRCYELVERLEKWHLAEWRR
jgi:hypothetical protein